MATALIGYTGFVGGNIKSQHTFDDLFNSRNIADIEGKRYDLVVSSANRAEMWRINQEPEKDKAEINEFISHIAKAKIKKLVLISTIGVYKNPNKSDESTPITLDGLSPYGVNRYFLEQYCKDNFDVSIIRLPGLFGVGLKKNVIFDLLNFNNVDKLHADGTYQYYDLSRIWEDISKVVNKKIGLVNFATPPVSTQEVAEYAFGMEFKNKPDDVIPSYWDMHTRYSQVFGTTGEYLCSKQEELERIKKFVGNYRMTKV